MQEKDFQPQDWFAGAKAPEGLSKDEAWAKLQSRIDEQETPVVKMQSKRTFWWAAAAAVAAAFVAAFFIPSGNTVELTAGLEVRSVNLPDGSQVLLDPNASLSYDAEAWEDERTLNLEGGAFFSVEKGSTFTVNTVHGNVQVLGTSFDVEADQQSFEVACYTGKVAVTHADDRVELNPGMSTQLAGDKLENPSNFKVYRDHAGNFHFEDASLGEVFAALGQAYEVSFECAFENERAPSIDIDAGQPLSEALDAMSLVGGFTYEIMGSAVRVMKK